MTQELMLSSVLQIIGMELFFYGLIRFRSPD